MRDSPHTSNEREAIDTAAAAWALRLDAALTAAEEEQFAAWLAADPRHAAALAESREAWDRFAPATAELAGRLPVPQIYAEPFDSAVTPRQDRHEERQSGLEEPAGRASSARRLHRLTPVLAAAAAIAIGLFVWRRDAPVPAMATTPVSFAALPPPCEERTLEDGTVITCNRGADVVAVFTLDERRVELRQGEAHFTVAKDPARPFIVSVGGLHIRAVGTAFNVKLDASALEVLVTEGRVSVASPPRAASGITNPPLVQTSAANLRPAIASPEAPILSAGQNIVIPLTAATPASQVAMLSAAQIQAKLAWQPRTLNYDDVPLSDIVAEFNRCNPVRLVVAGDSLRALRLTASFRSDNVQGFVRLLAANFGVSAEPRNHDEIELRRR